MTARLKATIAAEAYLRHRDNCPGCRKACDCDRCQAKGFGPKLCDRGKVLQTITNETSSEALSS